MAGPPMPSSCRHGKMNVTALANAPRPESESPVQPPPRPKDQATRRRRPYFFKMLQHQISTRILADTLDWDALMHFDFDATVLSLDNVYNGLNHDVETYYHLWVAVHKVLAEERNNVFCGARDQKAQFLNELLDAALEQFLAELGNAIMDFIDGPHCTIVDPRQDGDPQALRAKARSLVARFEKLGRDRGKVLVAISATEAGIDAATCLQREDGINVNLTSVSGVTHATACAQAGAAAVTLPIASMRNWRRGRTGKVVADPEGNSGTEGEEDAETIAAYFELHGISSTALIAGTMDHVDDACPLAALAAMSFDADQARKAEWYDTYPNVPRTPPERAMRRARAFPPPQADSKSDAGAFGLLRNLDAKEFSKFSAIVHTAVGSGQAVMAAIANIVKREIDWQLSLLQPMFVVPKRSTEMGAGTGTTTAAAAATGATQIQHNLRPRKRKRSLVRAPGSPGSPTPPERKRSKVTVARSVEHGQRSAPRRSSTPGPPDEPGGIKAAPAGSAGHRGLWEHLGGDTSQHRTTMTTRSGVARGGRRGAARVA